MMQAEVVWIEVPSSKSATVNVRGRRHRSSGNKCRLIVLRGAGTGVEEVAGRTMAVDVRCGGKALQAARSHCDAVAGSLPWIVLELLGGRLLIST